jgi:hypothetical protein
MWVFTRKNCSVEIIVADVPSLFHHSPFAGANDEKVGLSGRFTRGVARRLVLPRAIIFRPFRASGISLNGFDRARKNYIFDPCVKCRRAAPFWPRCLIKSGKERGSVSRSTVENQNVTGPFLCSPTANPLRVAGPRSVPLDPIKP